MPAGCTLGGQEVQLSIHYENGFSVCCPEAGGSVLFRYPYERLKMSADDGIRTLYLDFGGPEGELVRRGQLGSSPGSGDLLPGVAPASPHPCSILQGTGSWGPPARAAPPAWLVGCGGADTTVPLPPPTPGAGPALVPQAPRLHPAHLPLGQSHPHGAAGVAGPGPPPATPPLQTSRGKRRGHPPAPAPPVPCRGWGSPPQDGCPGGG